MPDSWGRRTIRYVLGFDTMATLELECGGCTITLTDGSPQDWHPADARAILVRDHPSARDPVPHPTTLVHMIARDHESTRWRLSIAGDAAPTEVRPNAAICLGDRFAVIVSSFVACLVAATGEVLWAQCCDLGSCFALHRLPNSDHLIVHGETDITRLSRSGAVLWQSGGRDIFTGPFTIRTDGIYATDFNGNIYHVDLETGDSRIIRHELPWPHQG